MKLIYLEWEDATSGDDGWQHAESVLDWAKSYKFIAKQVGFVLVESKESIVLASGFNEGGEYQNQYLHIHKIPKGWIRKRVDLTKHIKE